MIKDKGTKKPEKEQSENTAPGVSESTKKERAVRNNGKTSGVFRYGTDAAANGIQSFFASSFIGRFFCGGESFERATRGSLIVSSVSGLRKRLTSRSDRQPKKAFGTGDYGGTVGIYNENSLNSPLKVRINRAIGNSRIVSGISDFLLMLTALPVMALGMFMLVFGITVIGTQSLKLFLNDFPAESVFTMLQGLLILLLSIPVLISREESISGAIRSGRIGSFLLCSVLGMGNEEKKPKYIPSRPGLLMFFAGLVCGGLTYLFSPCRIIVFVLLIVCAVRVLIVPEFGVIAALLLAPFVSLIGDGTVVITVMSFYISFCFFLKAAAGKRVIDFRFGDLLLLLFGLICFFLSLSDSDGVKNALTLLSLMLVSYVVRNLIRSAKWEERTINSFIASSFLLSAVSVIRMIIEQRLTATDVTGSKQATVIYLSAGLIVTLSKAFAVKKHRLAYLFLILLHVAAMIGAGSWLVAAVTFFAVIFFYLICSRRALAIVLLLILAIPLISCFIPGSAAGDFIKRATFTDPSQTFKVSVWSVSSSMAGDTLLSGIGLSGERFASMFSLYAPADAAVSDSAMSLPLSLLIKVGLIGFLFFVSIFLTAAVRAFTLVSKDKKDGRHAIYALGYFSALLALFLIGILCDIWQSGPTTFVFWMLIGAIPSAALCSANESRTETDVFEEYSCDMRLDFGKSDRRKIKTSKERR